MKFLKLMLLAVVCLFFSCSSGMNRTRLLNNDELQQPHFITDTSKLPNTYVKTGFYLLADNLNGVKMRKVHTDEVYSLAKNPSVSVNNILHCTMETDTTDNSLSIFMELDEKGTQELKSITGNPLYPYIAIVIAGKLLYVAQIQAQITTGKTRILIDGYSKEEVQAMVEDVKNKK